MKRFVANFNDGHGMNIQADRMETTQDGNALLIYDDGQLVGYADLSAVISAHLSEQGEKRERVAL